MGLFCGMATITTSHILSFVLKAQVGPGALKQGLPKGQGVAQLLAAPKGAGPPGLAAHHSAGCEKNWPVLWICREGWLLMPCSWLAAPVHGA